MRLSHPDVMKDHRSRRFCPIKKRRLLSSGLCSTPAARNYGFHFFKALATLFAGRHQVRRYRPSSSFWKVALPRLRRRIIINPEISVPVTAIINCAAWYYSGRTDGAVTTCCEYGRDMATTSMSLAVGLSCILSKAAGRRLKDSSLILPISATELRQRKSLCCWHCIRLQAETISSLSGYLCQSPAWVVACDIRRVKSCPQCCLHRADLAKQLLYCCIWLALDRSRTEAFIQR